MRGCQIDVYACEPGWEATLSGELARVFPGAELAVSAPGWIECLGTSSRPRSPADPPYSHTVAEDISYSPDSPCVAFAAQCLPHAVEATGRSISRWAADTGQWLIERLDGHSGPWRLHVFCVPSGEVEVTPARCRYIEQAISDLLRKKQRRLLRTWNHDSEPLPAADEWLLQLGLCTATTGYLSSLGPHQWHSWRRGVSRFPGGTVEVPPDRKAPSRAFAKLAEVELRLARPILPGETCVDLGSSPGSWAYWALKRGAQVVAIDRAALRADLTTNQRLTFHRGDAFRYRPAEPVDWLLCDVIAFPAKIIELAEQWLAQGWCRHFCVTIKFRGRDDDARLEPLKAALAAAGHDFYLRRLEANKNEVTLFGHVGGVRQ